LSCDQSDVFRLQGNGELISSVHAVRSHPQEGTLAKIRLFAFGIGDTLAGSSTTDASSPEFHWRNIVKEKYYVTPVPKIYSLVTPDHDAQELSVKIKSPVPLTVAVLPSQLAGQFYDKTITLSQALDQTGCREQGVQSLSFNCTFNVANGPQTIRRTRITPLQNSPISQQII
jgi:hypothetical protein